MTEEMVNDKINSNNSAECTIVAVFFFTINEKNKKNCTDNIIYYWTLQERSINGREGKKENSV